MTGLTTQDPTRPYRHLSLPVQAASVTYRNNGTNGNLQRLVQAWGDLLGDARPPRSLTLHDAGGAVYDASRAYRARPAADTMDALRGAWTDYLSAAGDTWACFTPGDRSGACAGLHLDAISNELSGACPHCAHFTPDVTA